MAEEKVNPTATEEEAPKAEETKTEVAKAAPKKKAAPKAEKAGEKTEAKPAAKKAAKKAEGEEKTAPKKKAAAKKNEGKETPKSTRKGETVTVGTKAKASEEKLAAGSVKLTLKRGMMGCTQRQKAIVYSLGLKRPGDVSVQPDNAPTNGKIAKIGFLLHVSRA